MTDAPTYIEDKLTILIEGLNIPPFQNHIQIPSFFTSIKASYFFEIIMRIFIDMDDVLVELLDEWLVKLNKISKYHREPEDIVNWDMKLAYPDLTSNQLYNLLFDETMWSNIKPVKNAYKYLKQLIDDGHEVYIATSSSPRSFFIKTEYCLLKHFDFLTPKNLICINDKYLLDGDVLFDDYHENLRKFKGVKVLKDAPYNRNCDRQRTYAKTRRLFNNVFPINLTCKNVL